MPHSPIQPTLIPPPSHTVPSLPLIPHQNAVTRHPILTYPVPSYLHTPFQPPIILHSYLPLYHSLMSPHTPSHLTLISHSNLPSFSASTCPVFSYSYTPCQRRLVGQLVGQDEISFSTRNLGIRPCALFRWSSPTDTCF